MKTPAKATCTERRRNRSPAQHPRRRKRVSEKKLLGTILRCIKALGFTAKTKKKFPTARNCLRSRRRAPVAEKPFTGCCSNSDAKPASKAPKAISINDPRDQRTAFRQRVYQLMLHALMGGSTLQGMADYVADTLIDDRSAAEAFPEQLESPF